MTTDIVMRTLDLSRRTEEAPGDATCRVAAPLRPSLSELTDPSASRSPRGLLTGECIRLTRRLLQERCGHQRVQHEVARLRIETPQAPDLRFGQNQARHVPVFGLNQARPIRHRALLGTHHGSVEMVGTTRPPMSPNSNAYAARRVGVNLKQCTMTSGEGGEKFAPVRNCRQRDI